MKPLTILLVDDDKDDQFFFTEALKTINDTIICNLADDGFKGLNYLNNNPNPDIIFLDLNMPLMNGFDFLKTIKEDKNNCTIPVIIFSTSSDNIDIKKAAELKAAAFLTKPTSLTKLSQRLADVLNTELTIGQAIKIID